MIMKKSIKKISALAMAMALTAVSVVPAFAEESVTLSGTIADADLKINMTLPTNGTITIKPYGAKQILTSPLYFQNTNAVATKTGEDIVTYNVGLAGYTCVATSANEDDPINVTTAAVDTSVKTKDITANIELGDVISGSSVTTDAIGFKGQFTSPKTLQVTKLSEENYDAKAEDSQYEENANASTDVVSIAPGDAAPFRITGTMNTSANWKAGDKITFVPIFSVGVQASKKSQ
jgi:hypothetical protein